ncbi:voltage-gated potassium channel [Mollisia scopiformis]|uniref:Voltage-gated potassium channel n=1 Tax=Mollisia scopiformis TaxID=149040 RepID=A0A132B1U0_MOLSC|nr:voltage-gated potassium channel [Mollisia scopiformis]KUJ06261.1 voltage-gated potassium channel [Mollisia scopiformis]
MGGQENGSNGRTYSKGRSSTGGSRSDSNTLERQDTVLTIGKFKLRGKTDDLPQDWWFASTAIPLLAATIGPLANVLSIAALVSKWRVTLPDNGQLPAGTDDAGIDIADPHWEVILNAISLACGFFGNFCLLLNFTRRIRYIVALPATIISWYFATGILIAITVAMNEHVPPVRPGETYSQGFWHAVIAAVLYLVGSMILMVNMLGYFLGHYPQHFDLDDDQRTLILQTMMFFFWLAGGAAVFARVNDHMSYADSLYFCDVTVLTIGFGDIVPLNDTARGLVFPYSVIGIIFLGLMINSIRKFASSMSKDKIIRRHQLNERERTFGRSVTSEKELRDRLGLPPKSDMERRLSNTRKQSIGGIRRSSLEQYGHFDMHGRTITFQEKKHHHHGGRGGAARTNKPKAALSRDAKLQQRAAGKGEHAKRANRREKLILLKEEKDRFDAMREIQSNTSRFKQYYALAMSGFAFGLLWCVGAVVFFVAEKRIQNLSYFEALYFCYVSLLTIGYGDLSPRSNAGKPFFVVWSLVAIPTMTILVSDMGDTVVTAINRGTFTLADWTVMPKEGRWHDFLENHPRIKNWLERREKEKEAKKRIEQGFALQNPDDEGDGIIDGPPTLEKLAEEPSPPSEHELARKLAVAIKKTANDLRSEKPKKYSYEEWVEFTRLIRFSGQNPEDAQDEEDEDGLIEWDWIGEDSPMLADVSESEWILDRLCESLNRYTRKQAKEYRLHTVQSTSVLSAIKATALHDRNAEIYPAHPAPRTPYSFTHTSHSYASTSPVLSRGPSGDQVVTIHHKTPDERAEEAALELELSKERLMTSSGSAEVSGGSGSGTTAVEEFKIGADDDEDEVEAEEGLEEELQNAEVRDWARRVSGDELKRIDISGKGRDADSPE